MADHKLPAVTLEELEKIITGYANLGSDVSLDDISGLITLSKSTISRNNGFLKDVGIIEGGKSKSVTPIGKKLGRAIEHDQSEDVTDYWREVVSGSEFLSDLVSAVRINKGIKPDELASQVLYKAGKSSNKYNETGSRTVVEILRKCNLVKDVNGELVVSKDGDKAKSSSSDGSQGMKSDETEDVGEVASPTRIASRSNSVDPTITINIELQLPETQNSEVYDNLFKSLRENLLNSNDE